MVVWKVALPLGFNVTLAASTVEPSTKLTVPEGMPAAGKTPLTVAVKVTRCPKTDGSAEELTATLVGVGWTTCGASESLPWLVLKLPLPL